MIVKRLKITKEKMVMITLFLGSFFLPFGYDGLFALIMNWTGSYWITDGIFYIISGGFFLTYFLLRRSLKNKTSN